MKKLLTSTLIFIVFLGCILIIPNISNAQSSSYKISGYVLDSNGKGLVGAVFNLYPGGQVTTDDSGHYQISVSTGYHTLNVWPPFDSNYLAYTEDGFFVGTTDITKNITLTVGVKLSGYIKDMSGAPIWGALGFLDDYYTGRYSNQSGYYFITAPPGTYTLKFEPKNGPTFRTFNQFNVVLNQNAFKNITIGDPENLPNYEVSGYISDANGKGISGATIIFGVSYVTPAHSDSTGHYMASAPSGTYHVNVWPPFDSNYLAYDQPALTVGTEDFTKNMTLDTGCKLSGYLTDSSGIPIRGAIVGFLLGTKEVHSGLYSNDSGYYFVTAPAGTYSALKVLPKTGPAFTDITEANFTLNGDLSRNFVLDTSVNAKIMEIRSNSTVSDLIFNGTSRLLSFKVSGVTETKGYTEALISKTLVPSFNGVTIFMDGKNLTSYNLSSIGNYWLLEFTYGHSTHQVDINLASIDTIPESTTYGLIIGVVLASVALALARKKFGLPRQPASF